MMDPSNISPADGLEAVHQNGVPDEPSNSGKDSIVSNDVDPSIAEITETVTSNGNIENDVLLDDTATINLSVAEIKEESNDSAVCNSVTISKAKDVKITVQSEQVRASKGPVKNKNGKSPSLKGAHASGVKKSKDGKDEEAQSSAPNGSLALNTRQPIKSRSFNDRKTQISKHSDKSDAAASGAPTENTKPKSLKKETHDKVQGEAQSSSVTTGDGKPRKVGTLPNYGFSFKCDERAERRKEFYTKLEEKIHAKEVEKSNIQAKTKETQEAEIKMLRKTLAFKATPMPSFYQEPSPPKVELKKIPTTRAKSPKLGRRKNSTDSESDGNPSSSAHQGRLSLDEKVSQINLTKGVTHVHQKKPQRRSLPSRLPSERTGSSHSTTTVTSSKAQNDGKTALSGVTNEDTPLSNVRGKQKSQMDADYEENGTSSYSASEAPFLIEEQNATIDKPIETEPHVNGDVVVEEQPQIPLVQEPIAAEH
ncbi:protein WVD2-like 5 [Senna tora]|uniref:Protein WVD2-like 5 n=1 Tax=Senna tora TaxID=362788 RepID=A0A834WCA4_9FABA|nr:protein WVD2-like 5 [Senna tora]